MLIFNKSTDIEILSAILRRLIKKREAGILLGFVAGCPVVDGLVRNGMIIPFITSPEQLPRSFDALRSDVEDLITNLRNHCKTEPPPADALRLGPSLGVSIADFSLALSSGKIKNAWTDTKGVGLRSILIAEEEVRAMRIANLSGERLNTPQPPAPTFEYWKERANHFTPIN